MKLGNDSARVIIFKKVLLLIDKHFHCKDTAVSFNMGLKIWQAEFRNIVPFELVEYVPTKYEQFLRILSPLFLEGYTRLYAINSLQSPVTVSTVVAIFAYLARWSSQL